MSDLMDYLMQNLSNNKWVILYITLASVSGVVLSVAGLYHRFGPDLKRVVFSNSGYCYLALSAFGASLFTLIMNSVGVDMIENDYLNWILTSLIGAGLFLGVLSRIAVNEQVDDNLNKIKTLSDYIYDSINDSMTRKIDLEKGDEVINLLTEYDIDAFIKPLPGAKDRRGVITQLIDTNSYLPEDKKNKLKQDIEDCINDGSYALLFFKLTKSETNITIDRLKKYLQGSRIPKKS